MMPVQYFNLVDGENEDRKDKFTNLLNTMITNNRKKKERICALRKNKMKGL